MDKYMNTSMYTEFFFQSEQLKDMCITNRQLCWETYTALCVFSKEMQMLAGQKEAGQAGRTDGQAGRQTGRQAAGFSRTVVQQPGSPTSLHYWYTPWQAAAQACFPALIGVFSWGLVCFLFICYHKYIKSQVKLIKWSNSCKEEEHKSPKRALMWTSSIYASLGQNPMFFCSISSIFTGEVWTGSQSCGKL